MVTANTQGPVPVRSLPIQNMADAITLDMICFRSPVSSMISAAILVSTGLGCLLLFLF